MLRNRWPDQIGTGGRMPSDSVAGYCRNAHVAVDEHSVTVRMADNTIIEVRHDGSVKRRSAEDETHVEADGSIFKWTEHAEAHMTGDGVELTRRAEDRIAAIKADGVVDRSRKR